MLEVLPMLSSSSYKVALKVKALKWKRRWSLELPSVPHGIHILGHISNLAGKHDSQERWQLVWFSSLSFLKLNFFFSIKSVKWESVTFLINSWNCLSYLTHMKQGIIQKLHNFIALLFLEVTKIWWKSSLVLILKPKCSEAKVGEIVDTLFFLFFTHFNFCDFRLQLGEFCVKAACVAVTPQIWCKRGVYFPLQSQMAILM